MAIIRIPTTERIVNYLKARRGPALMYDLSVLGTAAEVAEAVTALLKSGDLETVQVPGLRLKGADDRRQADPALYEELERRRDDERD